MSVTGEWSKPFEGVLEHLDILLLDEAEAKNISRKRRTEDAVEALLSRGCATVAVKAGKMGCIVGERGRILWTKPFKTRPISTIGPGDAFDAAFIYGALKRWTLEKIAEFSNVVAALSTTRLGCMTAVPKARIAEKITESYYR
jgi:sugar/nucleoside kinase (ribokinase family)